MSNSKPPADLKEVVKRHKEFNDSHLPRNSKSIDFKRRLAPGELATEFKKMNTRRGLDEDIQLAVTETLTFCESIKTLCSDGKPIDAKIVGTFQEIVKSTIIAVVNNTKPKKIDNIQIMRDALESLEETTGIRAMYDLEKK